MLDKVIAEFASYNTLDWIVSCVVVIGFLCIVFNKKTIEFFKEWYKNKF